MLSLVWKLNPVALPPGCLPSWERGEVLSNSATQLEIFRQVGHGLVGPNSFSAMALPSGWIVYLWGVRGKWIWSSHGQEEELLCR